MSHLHTCHTCFWGCRGGEGRTRLSKLFRLLKNNPLKSAVALLIFVSNPSLFPKTPVKAVNAVNSFPVPFYLPSSLTRSFLKFQFHSRPYLEGHTRLQKHLIFQGLRNFA